MEDSINFTECLHTNIGNRIKKYRKDEGLTQKQFIIELENFYGKDKEEVVDIKYPIDRFRLSGIENIKMHEKKNPNFLSPQQIKLFEDYIYGSKDVIENEIIFGDIKERENLVKLIILAIMMNGAKNNDSTEKLNPIIDTSVTLEDSQGLIKKGLGKEENRDVKEFIDLSYYTIRNDELSNFLSYMYSNYNRLEEDNEDLQKECINHFEMCKEWYKKNYPLFSEIALFNDMEILIGEYNKKLETQSNLIIKLLCGNAKFSISFMEGVKNLLFSQKTTPDLIDEEDLKNINDIEKNSGQYGGLAIDYKTYKYLEFMKAFNEMWDRNGNYFVDYFNETLFNLDFRKDGLKIINDEFFHKLITSSKFIELLYERLESENYNLETIIGHNILRNTTQRIMIEGNNSLLDLSHDLSDESGYSLYKYNHDISKITKHYLNLNGNDTNSTIFLLYKDDYLSANDLNKN